VPKTASAKTKKVSHLSALPNGKEVRTALLVAELLGVHVSKNKLSSNDVAQAIQKNIDKQISVLRRENQNLRSANELICQKYCESQSQIKVLLGRAEALGIDLTKDLITEPAKDAPGIDLEVSPQSTQTTQGTQESSQWVSKPSRRTSRQAEQEAAA
jgi:FtsZ-binding cell division protein ZapB